MNKKTWIYAVLLLVSLGAGLFGFGFGRAFGLAECQAYRRMIRGSVHKATMDLIRALDGLRLQDDCAGLKRLVSEVDTGTDHGAMTATNWEDHFDNVISSALTKSEVNPPK